MHDDDPKIAGSSNHYSTIFLDEFKTEKRNTCKQKSFCHSNL